MHMYVDGGPGCAPVTGAPGSGGPIVRTVRAHVGRRNHAALCSFCGATSWQELRAGEDGNHYRRASKSSIVWRKRIRERSDVLRGAARRIHVCQKALLHRPVAWIHTSRSLQGLAGAGEMRAFAAWTWMRVQVACGGRISMQAAGIFTLLLALQAAPWGALAVSCPVCGQEEVPYPLSTGAGCGQPQYQLLCLNGSLVFPAKSGNYRVLSVQGSSRTLVLQSPNISGPGCSSPDLLQGGLTINAASPFSLSAANTVFLLNCSQQMFLSPLNCSSTSLCHSYLSQGPSSALSEGCSASTSLICCTFATGGSTTSNGLPFQEGVCSAYVSVVDVDSTRTPSSWKYGIQLTWSPAPLPPCTLGTPGQCGQHSRCLTVGSNSSREPASSAVCQCEPGYVWTDGVCVPGCTNGSCSTHKRRLVLPLAAVSLACSLFLAVSIVVSALACRRQRFVKQVESARIKELSDLLSQGSIGRAAKLYTAKEMKRATNGFSPDCVLGVGGFGEVYKGRLDDGTLVAVKTAKIGNIRGEEQVVNEVRILSQVNHRNLVRLLGCCVEMTQPLLVYEFVPNGALLDHLRPNKASAHGGQFRDVIILPWGLRLRIALQTAEALAYLHSSASTPIYHRDVKSSNILLDRDRNAKVSDFGISRLASLDLTHVSTCAQGTLGYLDPEYYRNYQLTDKSDVYSFGVVLLELVSSQQVIDFSRDQDDVNLAMYALRQNEAGNLMDIVDPNLRDASSPTRDDTILTVTRLALRCLQQSRLDRPSMKEVVEELQHLEDVEFYGPPDTWGPLPSQSTTTTVPDSPYDSDG